MTERKWAGNPDLESHLIPIDDIILLPGNPRQGDVGEIAVSLERFGQQKPVVVKKDRVDLAGNHTAMAAKALGWTHLAVTESTLEGAEANAFALADNRLSDLATYDDHALLDMIEEVHDATGDLAGTGYDLDFVEELSNELDQPLDFNPGDERYTPEWLFEGMGVTFTVDLAAPPGGVDWIPADRYYTKDDDALTKDWTGEFAWCNPPFSIASSFGRKWLEEVTEGVWLGPVSHGEYRIRLMMEGGVVWLPNKLEFVQQSGYTEGIGFPVFMTGFGDKGHEALHNLTANEPDAGLLFNYVAGECGHLNADPGG